MTWRDRAACIGEPPEMFFPLDLVGSGGRDLRVAARNRQATRQALDVCARCEVTAECLDDAIAHDDHGVRGGTTEDMRRRARGRR